MKSFIFYILIVIVIGIHFVNYIPTKGQTVSMSGNIFALYSLRLGTHYSSVAVDFTPAPKQVCVQVSPNKPSNSIVPAFLNDGKFYTPAFVLPREKEYFLSTSDFQKDKFQERILKENRLHYELSQKDLSCPELAIPTPSSSFCQICKCPYTSYTAHIQDPGHLRQSRFSKANTFIKQLCTQVKKEKQPKKPGTKRKQITKVACNNRLRGKAHKTQPAKQKPGKQKNPGTLNGLNFSTNAPSLIPTPI